MRAVVLALADLGKSARMQYHARALAANGVEVDLVGFEGTALSKAIADDPRITVHRFPASSLRYKQDSRVAYALFAVLDTWRVSVRLWRVLRRLRQPDLVLTQNPPAFPTLAVSWFSLHRRNVRFVVDWHNLGFTVLRLRFGRWHPAVRLARWYERRDARLRRRQHLRVQRDGGVAGKPVRGAAAHRAVRPPGLGVHADRPG